MSAKLETNAESSFCSGRRPPPARRAQPLTTLATFNGANGAIPLCHRPGLQMQTSTGTTNLGRRTGR